MTQETQSTALVTLPKEFAKEFLFNKFKEVEHEVESHVPDVETAEGRKYIKDLALKINKSKTVLDNPMRAHLRELKALPKVLEENARESKQRFEKLREDVLKPLELAREAQDSTIDMLNMIPERCVSQSITVGDVNGWLKKIAEANELDIWPELQKKFKVAIEAATTTATVTLERLEAQEKQQAELDALRKQQAEAEQKEQERLIAEAAAKRATEMAEQKAIEEKAAIERRAVEAKQREEKAAADAEQAKRDAIESEKRRLQEIEDNKAREEAAKKQAELDKQAAIEQAAENERKRAEEQAAAEKQAAIDRENDKAHKAKINRANLNALMVAAGIDEETGKRVISAISKGELPDVRIYY